MSKNGVINDSKLPKLNLQSLVHRAQQIVNKKTKDMSESNLKYSQIDVTTRVRETIRLFLFSLEISKKKCNVICNEILTLLFGSMKNYDRILYSIMQQIKLLMPFLPPDQVRGTALEKMGIKTVWGDINKLLLIESYINKRMVIKWNECKSRPLKVHFEGEEEDLEEMEYGHSVQEQREVESELTSDNYGGDNQDEQDNDDGSSLKKMSPDLNKNRNVVIRFGNLVLDQESSEIKGDVKNSGIAPQPVLFDEGEDEGEVIGSDGIAQQQASSEMEEDREDSDRQSLQTSYDMEEVKGQSLSNAPNLQALYNMEGVEAQSLSDGIVFQQAFTQEKKGQAFDPQEASPCEQDSQGKLLFTHEQFPQQDSYNMQKHKRQRLSENEEEREVAFDSDGLVLPQLPSEVDEDEEQAFDTDGMVFPLASSDIEVEEDEDKIVVETRHRKQGEFKIKERVEEPILSGNDLGLLPDTAIAEQVAVELTVELFGTTTLLDRENEPKSPNINTGWKQQAPATVERFGTTTLYQMDSNNEPKSPNINTGWKQQAPATVERFGTTTLYQMDSDNEPNSPIINTGWKQQAPATVERFGTTTLYQMDSDNEPNSPIINTGWKQQAPATVERFGTTTLYQMDSDNEPKSPNINTGWKQQAPATVERFGTTTLYQMDSDNEPNSPIINTGWKQQAPATVERFGTTTLYQMDSDNEPKSPNINTGWKQQAPATVERFGTTTLYQMDSDNESNSPIINTGWKKRALERFGTTSRFQVDREDERNSVSAGWKQHAVKRLTKTLLTRFVSLEEQLRTFDDDKENALEPPKYKKTKM